MRLRLFLRRLSAFLLPASAVLFLLWGGAPHRVSAGEGMSSAVLSEVMWMGSDVSTSDEWLEIACIGSGDCDLTGWKLTTLKSTGEEATVVSFATGTLLTAGDVRVISRYAAPSSRLAAEPWIVTSAMSLPNTKLLLKLVDARGAVRDEVDDGVGNPFAGANPSGGPKASMERVDLAAPGNVPENWRTATESSGFDPGPPIFGTPGVLPSISSSSSSDSESSGASSSVTFASSESSLSSSETSLSSSTSSSGSSFSSLSSLPSLSSSASSASSLSSEASAKEDVSSPSVLITEVLANPLGADTDEWIEIGNFGAESVNIAGWVLGVGSSHAYRIPPDFAPYGATPGWPQSGSSFLLEPGSFFSFRKPVTGLPLKNSGDRVSLLSGATVIDAWEYPETAEEVSFGRDPSDPSSLRPFCVPTEGAPNSAAPLPARIVIQDAGNASYGASSVVGTDHVSLNLTTEVGAGSLASASCAWDFGDDAVSVSCNPPSHTFGDPGEYTVRLTVRDFCGGIALSTLSVTVLPEEDSSVSSVSPVTFVSSVSSVSSSINITVPVRVETGVTLNEVDQHDEWIELFNPTDHTISLDGWVLDDLKDGGSKPWVIPAGTAMRPGEFLIFPGSETHLKLNDDGDEVWLIAPDGSWSQRVIIPKLKAGTSFSFCGGKLARRSPAPVFAELGLGEVGWRASDPTPGAPNACELSSESSSFSSMSSKRAKKSPPRPTAKSPFPTRYVLSLPEPVEASGTLMLTGSWVDLPPALATAGQPPSGTRAAEAGAVGGLSLLGVVLVTTRWRSLWGAGKLLLKL